MQKDTKKDAQKRWCERPGSSALLALLGVSTAGVLASLLEPPPSSLTTVVAKPASNGCAAETVAERLNLAGRQFRAQVKG